MKNLKSRTGFALSLASFMVVSALNGATNPYEAITARNAFGIKPPAPPLPPEPPKIPTPKIKLQGMTTILGKKMVIFKTQLPAKPPEQPQPKDVSFMLSEGQREGEIEVLEINTETGTVRLQNYGVDQTLSMKEDADKPVAMVSTPVPGVMPGSIPPPTPAAAPAAASPGNVAPAATTIGGQRTIPTRNVRSAGESGGGAANMAGENKSPIANAETSAALYVINQAKNEKLRQAGVPMPKLPAHPLFKGDGTTVTPPPPTP